MLNYNLLRVPFKDLNRPLKKKTDISYENSFIQL